MSTEAKKYRLWKGVCAFRRDGSPVAGTLGSTHRSVVIIETETFRKMLKDHPSMQGADVVYEIGEL